MLEIQVASSLVSSSSDLAKAFGLQLRLCTVHKCADGRTQTVLVVPTEAQEEKRTQALEAMKASVQGYAT